MAPTAVLALLTLLAGTTAPKSGEELVRQGYAISYGGLSNPYHDAETEAKDAKRGIWRGTFEQPSDWRKAHPRQ